MKTVNYYYIKVYSNKYHAGGKTINKNGLLELNHTRKHFLHRKYTLKEIVLVYKIPFFRNLKFSISVHLFVQTDMILMQYDMSQ